jgi:hypothetical protein
MSKEKDNSKSKSKKVETETDVTEKWKLFACLSYAGVMILIGIPIW